MHPGLGVLASSFPRPYIDTHPIGIAWLVLAITSGVIEITGYFHHRSEATSRDRGSQIVLRVFAVPATILLVLSPKIVPAAEIHPPIDSVIVGMVIFACGEALRIWSRFTLGRYFTYYVMTSADQPVITDGPYRFVRHPSYSGILLMLIGVGAVYGNWFGLAAFVVIASGGLMYRIFVEENALTEAMGDRYRSYAATHKRLVPFVW
jgi:protein-S-isoprenylcysteine O-methyltransferase Ste14